VLHIRQQRDRWGRLQQPKTEAGNRDVDLHPALAEMLRRYISERESGFLFRSRTGTMLSPIAVYRDSLGPILRKGGTRSGALPCVSQVSRGDIAA